MSHAEDVAALEAMVPWDKPAFQSGIAALVGSTAGASRQWAADAQVLADLAALVPRCAGDERGGTPWTSFRREVAVARKISDPAAATAIRHAVRLTTVLPHTLHLLQAGTMPVVRASAFLDELDSYDDEIAGQIDADLADQVARTTPTRIKQLVVRAALELDTEAAARKTAAATDARKASLLPQPDGQASVLLTGPAVPITRWYTALDAQARSLKQAGDPRTLDQLRFDLAVSTLPCFTHPPAGPAAYQGLSPTIATAAKAGAPFTNPFAGSTAPAGLRPTGIEPASDDCRLGRPMQGMVLLPVETSLGLSNDPAWLDGYGWIDAPTARQLLVDAELRRVCTQTGTGQLVDVADRDVRPPPSPAGVRNLLLDWVRDPITLSDTGWRAEPRHDPSPGLRQYVQLRDRRCDGPTSSTLTARFADLDHNTPWPAGPTAAWNLYARNQRTHQLKHYGWTPLKTPTATIWISPTGQTIEIPHATTPPPGIDPDPAGLDPTLPDPDELAATDTAQTAPPHPDDLPPWVPRSEAGDDGTEWTWLDRTSTSTDTGSDATADTDSDEPPF